MLSVSLSLDPIVPIDNHHPPLRIYSKVQRIFNTLPHKIEFFNFKKVNFIDIIYELNKINWSLTFLNLDINTAVNKFNSICHEVLLKHVPIVTYNYNSFPIWFNKELRLLIKEKKRAHFKYKQSNHVSDYFTFSNLRLQCKQLSRSCYINFISKTQLSLVSKPKQFWKFINDRKQLNTFPKVMFLNNKTAQDGLNISNLFAEHFSSAYSHICPSTDDLKVTIADCIDLSKIDITVQEVFLALEKCKLNSSPGPDGIPEIVLSQCRYALTLPLHYLFSLSLSSGTFPDLWKSSYVQPVFKNGDRSNIINYRPISIMSSIPKLLESILLPKLNFSFSKYIIPQQFGFRPHTSTSSNLVAYHKYLMDVIEKGGQVDAIYTDISKAFDTINHAVLIRKLELMGVNNLMLKWFSSYISCRSQKVRLHGYVSNNISIPSGVPQGGHISPLLFILYMNDVGLVFKHAQFSMFADDLKLFYNINSLDDGSKLQDDFDNFKAWCYNNGLQVNINKCNSISFYRNKSPFNIAYYSDNYLLPKVDSIKDLGVIFSSSLSFTAHIQSITIKASRSLGFIIRNTRDFNNIVSLKTLYFALVRSVLEYCSILWNPYQLVWINKIERVQNKFLRFINTKIPNNCIIIDHCYEPLRRLVNINSLSSRRLYFDVIFIYKILHGTIKDSFLLSQINLSVPTFNSRSRPTFHIPSHKTLYGFFSPINRALVSCNNLQNKFDIFHSSQKALQNNIFSF
ncbi:unnamed protein product [Macrosiphum euphorbiae]|uniref:Reverse transcriptase domain-containing protein n=2 Tax=Macrosiphum euphorbiae TaxID=13131 RepID=A0AAV0Y0S8_9HEMI|nr:unnamed protein product [Macrosiphum euphorbiae]CAI6374333.1 unnamed protein product [Macrosiphum euphorbiae]